MRLANRAGANEKNTLGKRGEYLPRYIGVSGIGNRFYFRLGQEEMEKRVERVRWGWC